MSMLPRGRERGKEARGGGRKKVEGGRRRGKGEGERINQ